MSAKIHPFARVIAALARGISGVQVRWLGCIPEPRQRIYFANHTSHLDFVVLWSSLPVDLRANTRPVAAKDYWQSGFRSFLAQKVFRAVLVERGAAARLHEEHKGEEHAHSAAFAVIQQLAEAMGERDSLIFFPEGTRGTGETVVEFKSGLYHLAKRRPDVELIPAYLENLNRILPKGEFLPAPLVSTLTFGAPIRVEDGEHKHDFLERARNAVVSLRQKGRAEQ
ncbi:MAG TPA: lysophospholipid acyltransferase family protein [Candidatus Dormibacteraeota bacterium]|jgi:1-acyl-sn-glycerol-3-phosphate acyltransferase|nr:lysophospholipid acyltransferase family protein [Candidatus Dormibacteraeota bacterium]